MSRLQIPFPLPSQELIIYQHTIGYHTISFYNIAVRWYVTIWKQVLDHTRAIAYAIIRKKQWYDQLFGSVKTSPVSTDTLARTFYERLAPRGAHQDSRPLQTSNQSGEFTKSSSIKWWKHIIKNYSLKSPALKNVNFFQANHVI